MDFKYDRHNKYHRLLRQILIIAVSLVMFIEAWWVISIIANSPTVPNPADTFIALKEIIQHGDSMTGISLGTYVKSSMSTFLKGFGLALLVATPLGLILGRFETVRAFANPIIEVLRPRLALCRGSLQGDRPCHEERPCRRGLQHRRPQ